ncbi:MAG TPA: YfhO family protein [Actinomycetota bacterium]
MGATVTRPLTEPGTASDGRSGRAHRVLAAAAGPVLILACVLFALRGFVFQDRLTQAHPDILTFWLPRFSFLGRSLADGHIPLWNPFEMAGARYAADPQGGWLYLAPMALFSTLSPAAAMRAFIVVNPMLAGLGLFAFLRIERLSRFGATLGGLSLAMLMATSEIAVSMPFAGSLAWTTVTLVGAAGYRRASRWSRRFAWLALGGLGWSQVATAHLSHGLVVCTVLVTAYLAAGAVTDVRSGSSGWLQALAHATLFLIALPLLSLAVLIPRMDALQGSSLAAGYDRLGDALGTLGGGGESIQANGVWAGWPFAFGATPGAYAGAAILLGVPLALRARRYRNLMWAFGGALVVTWVGMLDAVVTNSFVRALVLKVPFGDVYLHNPGRMRYLAVIAIPVLGAIGIQGLRDEPMPARRATRWLGAGALLWLGVPMAMRAYPVHYVFLALALIAAGFALHALATRRSTWAWAAVATVLVIELVGSALWSHATPFGDTVRTGLEGGEHPNLVPQPLPLPEVDAAAFTAPTAFVAGLKASQERYLTWAPPAAFFEKGYLFMQSEPDWPALAMERGSLFGVQDVLGYNPVQLPRYWDYLRARTDLPVFYNAAVIDVPTALDVGLLGIRFLIIPTGITSPLPGTIVDQGQGYDLIELDEASQRASVIPAWTVVGSKTSALETVLSPGFDPATHAVLESDPGLIQVPGSVPGSATTTETEPESIAVDVEAGAPSIVVVRSSYDEGWTAEVDGTSTQVLPADGFLLGVAVDTGTHQVRLTYRDPSVGRGLAAGIVAWTALVVAAAAAAVMERRRSRAALPTGPPGPTSDDGDR